MQVRNTSILILIQVLFIFSCGNSGSNKKPRIEGDIFVDGSGNVINKIDDSNLKQGKWMTYHEGDESSTTNLPYLEYEGFYKDDKKEGYWKEYSRYGEIKDSVLYVEGVQKINGIKTYTVKSN